MSDYKAGSNYDEGFKARYSGQHRTGNPYSIRSMQGSDWLTGWTDADNRIYEEAKTRNLNQLNEQGHGKQFLQD
jgi:ribosome modulation factor